MLQQTCQDAVAASSRHVAHRSIAVKNRLAVCDFEHAPGVLMNCPRIGELADKPEQDSSKHFTMRLLYSQRGSYSSVAYFLAIGLRQVVHHARYHGLNSD